MKIKKLTGEDGEVKFEVYEVKEGFGEPWENYVGSFSSENLAKLKSALNARNDI